MNQTEIIIIGSGIGGLCCAGLLAKYGYTVTVCESHSIPGGAAHSFTRNGYKFDSTSSLYSSMSFPSNNALAQILKAIEEEIEWLHYDTWGCCLPEGDFNTTVGADDFANFLLKLRGQEAVQQWRNLQQEMKPLAKAVNALPILAMRNDFAAIVSTFKYIPNTLWHTPNILKLIGNFETIMNGVVQDKFIRNWLNLLSFLLSGLPANGTSAAEMSFMFAEWYKPGVVLDYPLGGSGALVDALVRGFTKRNGTLLLNSYVDSILVENNRAVGVKLKNKEIIRATKAVISNASVWDTLKLLPNKSVPQNWIEQRSATPHCDSFRHFHLGIDATGLPSDLQCHYIIVNDWELEINAPQNIIVVSIPSVLDPNLAPPGKHVIHVYTPGNEPYELWSGMTRDSQEYQELKEKRSQIIWQSLNRIIPDIQSRCELTLIGTPLTHQRFLRRDRGSYGPAIIAGKETFPGSTTPLPGLFCCGDSTFPGIGLPAVAASGAICANTIANVGQHLDLLKFLNL